MAVVAPDWKPDARIIDRHASKRKLLADPLCRACLERAVNCHHLIGKGQRGDDVEDNLIPLCGSGSHGCHGALHGTPYERNGEYWDAWRVRQSLGLRLRVEEARYAFGKLGLAAQEMLRQNYGVEVAFTERASLDTKPFTSEAFFPEPFAMRAFTDGRVETSRGR